jgi:hypothetical protein
LGPPGSGPAVLLGAGGRASTPSRPWNVSVFLRKSGLCVDFLRSSRPLAGPSVGQHLAVQPASVGRQEPEAAGCTAERSVLWVSLQSTHPTDTLTNPKQETAVPRRKRRDVLTGSSVAVTQRGTGALGNRDLRNADPKCVAVG